MARWNSSRSSAATICAPAVQGAGFKRCCLKRGAYDGALRAYYFQRVRAGGVKAPLAGSRIARPYGLPGLPFASLRAFGTRKGPLGLFACVPQDVPHPGKDECGVGAGGMDGVAAQTARAAAKAEDQAHWKLKPPRWPVTSTASPMKKRPGTAFASIVFEERCLASMPPAVTSAVR